MANLSSVARCAASPNNLRATVRVTATTDAFFLEPARRARLSATLLANARKHLFVPAPAEAAIAQVRVLSLS
jgi:hypothetical protein